ncbi:hypothetical protein [Pseudomonas mangiferae]|uniref:Uncharacterized protein n=1 Tax=Pseudomonas mangiferae TaxID=2593654 RepID=A0A553GUX6_9PSED|nr:hypothetical protein [Pseudomonas mangiferae]TRX73246.1 hypothetical protein FM069_18915 [Pseudomonas mangiferae]
MTLKLLIVIVSAVGAFFTLAIGVYMTILSLRILDEVESHLHRSALVKNNRNNMGGGWIGCTYRLLQINMALLMKEFFIKKGEMDQQDLLEFPTDLEKKITRPGRVLLVSGLFTFAVLIYARYSSVLH